MSTSLSWSRRVLAASIALGIGTSQHTHAQEFGPIVPPDGGAVQLPDSTPIRLRLYKDHLKLAYIRNPDIFKAHRAALESAPQALLWKAYIGGQLRVEEAIRKIPGFSVGEGVSIDLGGMAQVSAQIEFEKWKADRDHREREELLGHPDQMEAVASAIAEQMYGTPSDTVRSMVEFTRDKADLPYEVDVNALALDHPDVAGALERLRLERMSPEQQERFMSGDMSTDEFINITGLSRTEINLAVKSVSTAILVNPTPSVAKPADAAIEMEKHRKYVAQRSAEIFAISSIVGLVDRKAAHTIASVGQGSLQVYDAIQVMALTGMTLTGVGAVAAGLGAIMGGFGSSGDASAEMLAQVLENQRIMIAKLDSIENKIDVINEKVDYLVSITSLNHEQVIANLDNIRDSLTAIGLDQFEYQYRNSVMFQESDLKPLFSDIAALNELFDNRTQSSIWSGLTNCQTGLADCTPESAATMQKIRETLGSIRFHVVDGIRSSAFRPPLDINGMPGEQAAALIGGTAVEDRNGMLASLNDWFTRYAATAGKAIEDTPLQHPAYFGLLLDQYLTLAVRLPEEKAKDGNISLFCDAALDIEKRTGQARSASPAAWAGNLAAIDRVIGTYESVVANLTADFPFGPEKRPDDAFPFQTWENAEIAGYLAQLNGEQLTELALRLGLFTQSEEDRKGTKAAFDDTTPPGVTVWESWDYHIKIIRPTEQAAQRLARKTTDASGNPSLEVMSLIDQYYPDAVKFVSVNPQFYVDQILRGVDVYRKGWFSGIGGDLRWDGYLNLSRFSVLHSLLLHAILEKRDSIVARLPDYLRDDTPPLGNVVARLPDAIADWERARAAVDTAVRIGYGRLLDLDPKMTGVSQTLQAPENQGALYLKGLGGRELHERILKLKAFVARTNSLTFPAAEELGAKPGYGDPDLVRRFFLATAKYPELSAAGCPLQQP